MSDYYCNLCGCVEVDEKLNCMCCGDYLGDEQ